MVSAHSVDAFIGARCKVGELQGTAAHPVPGALVDNQILFVDDDPSILQGYQRILHREYCVRTAEGADQALTAFRTSGPFAVVISDMRMPGMNGAQFLSKVREHSPDTVRMLLTGYSDLDAAIQAVNEGSIFRYLSKPCEKEEMVKAIESALAVYRSTMANKELVKKAQLASRSTVEWESQDFHQEHTFYTLSGLPGPSEARAHLQPLFGSPSPYYVVLVKLGAMPVIEERYGVESATEYIQSTVDLLKKILLPADRLFHWTRDVLMLVLERRVSAVAMRIEMTRLMQSRQEFISEVAGSRIMIAAPATFDLLPVSGFAKPDDMLEAFDAKLRGIL